MSVVQNDDGKAPFVVVAILILIALVGGVLYFGADTQNNPAKTSSAFEKKSEPK